MSNDDLLKNENINKMFDYIKTPFNKNDSLKTLKKKKVGLYSVWKYFSV